MRIPSRPATRGFRLAALASVLVSLAACDSLPNSLGPSTDDLMAEYSITAWGSAPINHVLVHPVNNAAWCTLPDDSSRVGGVFDGTYHRSAGFSYRGKAGCYTMFVRFADAPGFYELRVALEDGDYDYVTFNPTPTVPPAGMADGSLRITNAATRHTAAISRIYTDACSPNGLTNQGSTGGETAVRQVNVAHGQSVTIALPRACHMITIIWANGWYQYGRYNITGTNTLSVGT